MNAKTGRKPKGEVTQTERLYMRATAELKQKYSQAGKVSPAGTASDFWQGVIDVVGSAVIDLNEARITPAEFKSMVAEQVYVLASPPPEPEPGENED